MWHILFQAFVKYHLHCKHLNKILFEIENFDLLQHFFEPIKNISSSTTKIQMLKKCKYGSKLNTKFSSINIKQEIFIYMTCLKIHL